MNPEIWGPHYWFVFHTYAHAYPEKPTEIVKNQAINFIKAIPFILPCLECSQHAFDYIFSFYPYFNTIVSSRENMVSFFREFHDNVNKRIGKEVLYSDI